MTLNLVASDYSGTRDFAVIDAGRADVAAIFATFNADFAGRVITPPDGADLVWSPTNAKASVLGPWFRPFRSWSAPARYSAGLFVR